MKDLMEKDITLLVSAEMRTTSMQVAKHFEKSHAHTLRAIQLIESTLAKINPKDRSTYGSISYVDAMNRTQQGVSMNRDGFTLLAMGFGGTKAFKWKLVYLAAFNAMEAKLVRDADKLDWKAARLGVKQARRSFTDTVANFVEYATSQGSQSAKMYYANITKMEYKALDLLERQKTAIGNFRDTLDIMDIAFLAAAEMVAKVAIEQGMEQKMHYKEIYIFAKQKVTDYANSVSFVRLAKPSH